MEKKKFKFSNEIMDGLLTRAKKLPPVAEVDGNTGQPRTRVAQVPGSRLSKEDLKPGQVLNPNLIYRVQQIVFVDHYRTMTEIYKEKGMQGVDDYEQATMALQHYSVNKLKMPWYKRILKHLKR